MSSWIPTLPHAFYGAATVNGRPVQIGEKVDARGPGVRWGRPGNPIVVTQEGQFGAAGGFLPKLIVQGNIESGTPLSFFVAGVPAVPQVPFRAGEVDEIALVAAGDPVPDPIAANWYLMDWFQQIVTSDPPDAEPPADGVLQQIMQKAYILRNYPLQYQQVENDDIYPLAMALGLGMPVTTRWMQTPYACQGFTSGVLIMPVGVIL